MWNGNLYCPRIAEGLALFRLSLAALASLTAYGEINWTIHQLPQATNSPRTYLTGVAYGNGYFVAVGDQGEIFRASDPHQWRFLERKPEVRFKATAFGGGLFVATGFDEANGTAVIFTSQNGDNWTPHLFDTPKWLDAVTYGDGVFLAAGHDIIARSENGVDWSLDTQFVRDPSVFFDALGFGAGIFVAAQRQPSGPPPRIVFFRSEEGDTWEHSADLHKYGAVGITYGRGRFFAAGKSADCSSCPGPNFVSSDGLAWSPVAAASAGAPRDAAFGNGAFVLPTYGSDGGELLISRDLAKWDAFKLDNSSYINGLTFANGRFVGVGTGIIAVSDEIEFQPLISNLSVQAGAVQFDADAPEGTTWEVQSSPDLREWSKIGTVLGTASGIQHLSYPSGVVAGFVRLKKVP